jgi:hypothetical protein
MLNCCHSGLGCVKAEECCYILLIPKKDNTQDALYFIYIGCFATIKCSGRGHGHMDVTSTEKRVWGEEITDLT